VTNRARLAERRDVVPIVFIAGLPRYHHHGPPDASAHCLRRQPANVPPSPVPWLTPPRASTLMGDISSTPPPVAVMGDAASGRRHGYASSTLVDPLSRLQQHFFWCVRAYRLKRVRGLCGSSSAAHHVVDRRRHICGQATRVPVLCMWAPCP
jgi:hypothetical protein